MSKCIQSPCFAIPPMLTHSNYNLPLIVHTNVSLDGWELYCMWFRMVQKELYFMLVVVEIFREKLSRSYARVLGSIVGSL